jgi:hypothetical protein
MDLDFHVDAIDQAIASCDFSGKTPSNFTGKTPVMPGFISNFPILNSNKVENYTINVAYIKLSIDTSKMNVYPTAVRTFYTKHKLDKSCFSGDPNGFPQHSTEDQSFTSDQVLAYLELGHFILTDNTTNLLGALHLENLKLNP